jgi:hypothetical protein
MVRRSPHRRTELPDPGPTRCDPVAQGADLLTLAQEGGSAAQAI